MANSDSQTNSSPLTRTETHITTGKRGRKPKSENASADLRWSVPMVETLLRLRREQHLRFFQSKHNPKAASEGWANVVKDFCQEHHIIVTLSKIRSKYDALLKKWRDFGPGKGKETKRTGNPKAEPNTLDDPILEIIAPYFAKSPGTGADLGQSTDEVLVAESDEDDANDSDDGRLDSDPSSTGPRKQQKRDGGGDLGDKMENAFALVSNSVCDLAKAVSGRSSQDMGLFMQQNRDALRSMQQSLDNSTKIQMAMLEVLQKLSNGGL